LKVFEAKRAAEAKLNMPWSRSSAFADALAQSRELLQVGLKHLRNLSFTDVKPK
jgi:hypothetical protein